MAFRGRQVTVTTSATLLTPSADEGSNGATAVITVGAVDIWVHGFNTVATDGTLGRKFFAGATVAIDLDPGEVLYGRTASSSSVCDVGEQGVG